MGKGQRDKQLDELRRLIDEIERVRIKPRNSPKFKSWQRETLEMLERLFGRKSRQVKDFESIRYNLATFSNKTSESKFEEAFQHGLMNAAVMLSSALKELQEEKSDIPQDTRQGSPSKPDSPPTKPVLPKPIADPVSPAVREILNASSSSATKEPPAIVKRAASAALNKVFLAYAKDMGMNDELSTFLNKVGISTVSLKDSTSSNANVIGELEKHDDVPYAIVMLNPDSSGISETTIYELGLIVGRLGRNRVCGMVKDRIDILANYSGVLYVPMDPAGGWKFLLIKQLKDAGFNIDANRAL